MIEAEDRLPKERKKRGFVKTAGWIAGALAMAFILATIALAVMRKTTGMDVMLRMVSTIRLYGFGIQILLIVALWFRWEKIINWLVDKQKLPEVSRELLLEKKNRWMSFLFFVEVFMFICTTPMAAK